MSVLECEKDYVVEWAVYQNETKEIAKSTAPVWLFANTFLCIFKVSFILARPPHSGAPSPLPVSLPMSVLECEKAYGVEWAVHRNEAKGLPRAPLRYWSDSHIPLFWS